MRFATHVSFLGLVLVLSGCASFGTNFLHRSEDNLSWQKEKHLQGVPVTLKVPTHVRIDVIEKSYIIQNSAQIERKNPAFPLRTVEYTPIETEKIFLVDLKRPAAGTIGATINFDADKQYFNSIQTEVTDETLSVISGLIAQVAPGGLIGSPTNESVSSSEIRKRIKELKTVVASAVFEFDAPDFEQQVSTFLGDHLNCCHQCEVKRPISPDPISNNPIYMARPAKTQTRPVDKTEDEGVQDAEAAHDRTLLRKRTEDWIVSARSDHVSARSSTTRDYYSK